MSRDRSADEVIKNRWVDQDLRKLESKFKRHVAFPDSPPLLCSVHNSAEKGLLGEM